MDDEEFDIPETGLTVSQMNDAPVPVESLRDDVYPLQAHEHEIKESIEGEFNRKVFLNEMATCDLYLHNIHKSFKFANSINAVLKLVNGGLTVMRQRRAVMHHVSQSQIAAKKRTEEPKQEVIEYDLMGNIITK